MGDQELRQLEREVRAGGSVEVVRRWSAALERAELLDETVDALLAALDRDPTDAHARRVLGAQPAWTAAFGPGGPAIDVAPLREAPVRRWTHPADRPRDGETTLSTPPLLGGALGVAVLHRGWTEVLDARTGARRWETGGASLDRSTVDGDVLLLRHGPDELVAYDLWTGRRRSAAPVAAGTLGVVGGRLVTWAKVGDEGRLEGRRWSYDAPPDPEPCWSFTVRGDQRPRWNPCGTRVALAGHGPEVAVLEAEVGLVWTRRGEYACGDERGIVVQSAGTSTLCDLDGTARWTTPGTLPAPGERRVLVQVSKAAGTAFTFVDRETGAVAAVHERPNASRRHALARDVVYFLEPGGLSAVSDEGTPLWSVPRSALPVGLVAVVPVHRGVVAYFDDLSVVSFGPSDH
jgi:hypothetical protein